MKSRGYLTAAGRWKFIFPQQPHEEQGWTREATQEDTQRPKEWGEKQGVVWNMQEAHDNT